MSVLLRTRTFDNSKSKYVPQFLNYDFEPIDVKWCWSVKERDLDSFLQEYSDVEWERVKPSEHTYAIDYKLFDRIVCGYHFPKSIVLEPFDPEKHSLQKVVVIEDYDTYEYFENPWAIIVCSAEPAILALLPKGKEYWWEGVLISITRG